MIEENHEILVEECKKYNYIYSPEFIEIIINKELVGNIHKQSDKPIFLCIGGLPGSGKTVFCEKNNFNRNYFIIDPDNYRKYHPDYMSLSPEDIIPITNDLVRITAMVLLKIALRLKLNIAIVSTFSDASFWLELYENNKQVLSKYNNKIIILTEPEDICKKSMITRYNYETKSNGIIARPIDFMFFNKCKSSFPDSLRTLQSSHIFNSFEIWKRENINQEYCILNTTETDLAVEWEKITQISTISDNYI